MDLLEVRQKVRYLFKSIGASPFSLKKFPAYLTFDLVA